MKFVNPWMLILVALVPVAGAWWGFLRARAEKRLNGLVAPALQGRLLPRAPKLFTVQAALMLAGLALVLFAAARPQWGHSAQKIQARTRNVVVALDVSRSMLATDVRPNRLERAKADIADLIDSLEGDRCALVAFRRTGTLLCPLTTDHGFLRSTLESTTPESAPHGETDLGSAIRTSLDALDPAADDHNAIILISDGGDLRGGARDAARLAAKRNVPVFTVGLGNPRAETAIPDSSGSGSQQYQGKAVMTKLEEAALAEIAKLSGGRYVPLATAGTAETTLGAIYRRFLRQVAAKEQAEEEELRATERFGIFLVPGLLLVLLAGMLSRGRFAGSAARKAMGALCMASVAWCIAGPCQAFADTNTSYLAQEAEATGDRHEAPNISLDDREVWNMGVDSYRAGDWTNALATLQPLMLSRTHGARASEVVGAIQHAKRKSAEVEDPVAAAKAAEEAAAAMQLALRAAPDDPRANRNFTRATDQLKELRETAHVAQVLKASEKEQMPTLLAAAKREALELFNAQQGVLTNEASRAIAESEALARRTEKLADRLIPLKQFVVQSVTNEQQAADIVGDIEATRGATRAAVEMLEDMSPDAAEKLSAAESAFHRYWKPTLDPLAALDEGLRAQTNVLAGVARENGRDWQDEAMDFTQVARGKFAAWAQQVCAQDMSFASNAPPFTVALAQEVAGQLVNLARKQAEVAKTPQPDAQVAVLSALRRLRARSGMLAMDPRAAIDADILCQTNAYMDVTNVDGGSWQRDAFDYTRVFRAKFPAWAQQKEQEIQQKIQNGNTNAVPFTKELQKEIATLAADVEKRQHVCTEKDLPPEQLDVLMKLGRIRELLPKDENSGGQSNQPQQQPQNQDQNQDQQQDQQQNQQDNQDQQQDEQQQQEEKRQSQAEEPKDDKEVEELLRKAQERSDEHENDKKMRMRKAPPSPNERDW